MQDIETIDFELRLVAAFRRAARERASAIEAQRMAGCDRITVP
jgi:hypothetical protein